MLQIHQITLAKHAQIIVFYVQVAQIANNAQILGI